MDKEYHDSIWNGCMVSDPTLEYFTRKAQVENTWHLRVFTSALAIGMTNYMKRRIKENT